MLVSTPILQKFSFRVSAHDFCPESFGSIQRRIDELDSEIKTRMASRGDDLRIAMSIPGIGFTSA
jgi:hypothetical protein